MGPTVLRLFGGPADSSYSRSRRLAPRSAGWGQARQISFSVSQLGQEWRPWSATTRNITWYVGGGPGSFPRTRTNSIWSSYLTSKQPFPSSGSVACSLVHLHFFERKSRQICLNSVYVGRAHPRRQPCRASQEGSQHNALVRDRVKLFCFRFFDTRGGKLLWRRYIGGFVGFLVGFVIAGLLGDT